MAVQALETMCRPPEPCAQHPLSRCALHCRSRGLLGALLIFVGLVTGLAGIIRVIAYRDPLAN